MRILILSVTAGTGHNSTAKAIQEYAEKQGNTCEILDTYEYLNPILGSAIDKGYLWSVEHLKAPYAKIYRILEKHDNNEVDFTKITNKMLTPKLRRYIEAFAPDVIICTHVFAAMLADYLKLKKRISSPIISILTDFTVHPFWESTRNSEHYIIANNMLEYATIKKGLKKEKLLPIGIPINPKFSIDNDKREMRRMLGIDEDKNTILIMGGGMGYGKLDLEISEIDKLEIDFQIICVCGSNIRAKSRVDRMKTKHKFLSLGFVNNIEQIMDASDMIITKPGGLTVSESMAKRLPMILVSAIPGQEDRNSEFLVNNGAAVATSSTYTLQEALYQLLNNPDRIEHIKSCIEVLRRPNSTRDLCDFITVLVAKQLSMQKNI